MEDKHIIGALERWHTWKNPKLKVSDSISYNIKGLTQGWRLKNKTYKNKLESQIFYKHNIEIKLIFCALHKEIKKSNIP